MSDSPIALPAQPKPVDPRNPYVVACLRWALEQGYSFQSLVKAMHWYRDQVWLAGVTELAHELGYIASEEPKPKKAKQCLEPNEEPLLPVALRSQTPQPPKPTNVITPSERREPASWIMDGENDDER